MYQIYNENPLGLFEDDCVVRSIACATNRTWDEVYDELSDLAQERGTLLDKRTFVRWYLDTHFWRIIKHPYKVIDVAKTFKNNVILCTVKGHIICIREGLILDSFYPGDRVVEDVWIVN